MRIRLFVLLAAMAMAALPLTSNGFAQTAADHAALAHGKPIANGHPLQPTPEVVQKRRRHHEMMLQSEREQSGTNTSMPQQVSPKSTSKGGAPNGQLQ